MVVQTDHQALRFFQDQPKRSPRQVRWQAFLSDYNVQIEYVKGEENPVADACSRRAELRLAAIRACADSDPFLQEILNAYTSDTDTRALIKSLNNKPSALYSMRSGMLYYTGHGGRALVCSSSRDLAR